MPHKRAKQSARLENRKKMGQNLAPGKDDGMSRRMREVLFGEQIRAELKQRKRSRDGADDEDEGNRSRKKGRTQSGDKEEELRIKPGESTGAFSRRVEEHYKEKMSEAYKTGRKQQKKEKKSKKAAATQSEGPKQSEKGGKGKTEFEGIETRRRVNDIAEAPPELPTLRRKASSGGGGAKLDGVVSGVQQRMMEEERLRAIERYRAMKQRQQQQHLGHALNPTSAA